MYTLNRKTDAECDADIDPIDVILDMFIIKFRRELKELLIGNKKNVVKCVSTNTTPTIPTIPIDYNQKILNRIHDPVENTTDYNQKLQNRLNINNKAKLQEIERLNIERTKRWKQRLMNEMFD